MSSARYGKNGGHDAILFSNSIEIESELLLVSILTSCNWFYIIIIISNNSNNNCNDSHNNFLGKKLNDVAKRRPDFHSHVETSGSVPPLSLGLGVQEKTSTIRRNGTWHRTFRSGGGKHTHGHYARNKQETINPVTLSHIRQKTMSSHRPPIFALKRHYDNVMSKNECSLFASFDSYVASLPVRRSDLLGDYLRLVDFPFYAREGDMEVMVLRLEENRGNESARSIVRYGCGQSGSGKTASICPAFLRSTSSQRASKFSTYLYLAFANNGGRSFAITGSDKISADTFIAEKQGATFMAECVQKLLFMGDDNFSIPVQSEILENSVEDIAKNMEQLFSKIMVPDGKILVHVDEHRKMSKNADFRRGALSMLALVPSIVVVATYVDIPTEINAAKSSSVCRRAVPIPMLDIEAVMVVTRILPDLSKMNRDHYRILASLKFRLALYLTGRMSDFHLGYSLETGVDLGKIQKNVSNLRGQNIVELRALFGAFRDYVVQPGKAKLENLVALLRNDAVLSQSAYQDEATKDMFSGVDEDRLDNLSHRLQGQLVAASPNESSVRFFYSLSTLLKSYPPYDTPYYDVYSECCWLFQTALSTKTDLISGTPLERAILWSLASSSSIFKCLDFPCNIRVRFHCKEVRKARIFPGDSIVLDDEVCNNIRDLKKNTLYYCNEGQESMQQTNNTNDSDLGGQTSHPLGDIFFRTGEGELVVIDVTSTPYSKMKKKRANAKLFAELWCTFPPEGVTGLRMIIFNPLENEKPSKMSEECNQLLYVLGDDARKMLGALVQCMAWYG